MLFSLQYFDLYIFRYLLYIFFSPAVSVNIDYFSSFFFVRPTQYTTYISKVIFLFILIEVVHINNRYHYKKNTSVLFWPHLLTSQPKKRAKNIYLCLWFLFLSFFLCIFLSAFDVQYRTEYIKRPRCNGENRKGKKPSIFFLFSSPSFITLTHIL